MANKGLKKETKQMSLGIGGTKLNINLYKQDANLIYSLPLLTTMGRNPISFEVIYNHQNKNTLGLFGKGTNLNLFKKLSNHETLYRLTNADGTIDTYTEGVINKETELKVEYSSNDSDEEAGSGNDNNDILEMVYKVVDKNNNYLEYNEALQDYPNKIRVNTTLYTVTKSDTEYKVESGINSVTLKLNNSMVYEIEYKFKQQLVMKSNLYYDQNNYLTKVEYVKENTEIDEVNIITQDTQITVTDKITKQKVECLLTSDKVEEVKLYYLEEATPVKTKRIMYENNYTKIIDEFNKEYMIVFDNSGKLLYEMDYLGNVVKTEYDNESKNVLYQSSVINMYDEEDTLNINNFNVEGSITITQESIIENDKYYNMFGQRVYKLEGTGTLKYEVEVDGIATDINTLAIFAKQLTANSTNSFVHISLIGDSTVSQEFSKTTIDNEYDLKVLGLAAKKTYSKIKVLIRLSDSSILIGKIKLIKKAFGNFYQYDEQQNTTSVVSGNNQVDIGYNSFNNMTNVLGTDSTYKTYEYDSNNNITEENYFYGVSVENKYNSHNEVTQTTIQDLFRNKKIETYNTYDDDGNLTENTDELGNITQYTYDSFNRLKSVLDPLHRLTEYEYDEFDNVVKMIVEDEEIYQDVDYVYEDNLLKKISSGNRDMYEFTYDSRLNLVEVRLYNTIIHKYSYNLNSNLEYKWNGNEIEGYRFEYEDNKIKNVYYVTNINRVGVLKYKYIYDNKQRLTQILDKEDNVLCQYTYDNDNKVVEVIENNNTNKYTYDNLGNINSLKTDDMYQTYSNVSRSKGSNPISILSFLEKGSSLYADFRTNSTLYSTNSNEYLESKNHSGDTTNVSIYRDGIIPYTKVNSQTLLSYCMNMNKSHPLETGSVAFWFRPKTLTTETCLFSCRTGTNTTNTYDLSINVSNSYVKFIMKKNTSNIVSKYIDTSNVIKLNEWNYLALTFNNREDEQNDSVSEYTLIINGQVETFRLDDTLNFNLGTNPYYNIGHFYNGQTSTMNFNGDITCLLVGKRSYMSVDYLLDYYKVTKDYLIENEYEENTVDFSLTNLYNQIEGFEIFPLNNDVMSLTNIRPIEFDIRNKSALDRDRTFNFNKYNKRYSFVADGNRLVYDLGDTNTQTILMKAYTNTLGTKQYLLECVDSSNNIGLYRSTNNKLVLMVNDTEYQTNLEFTNNMWHTVGLSFTSMISSDSFSVTYNIYFRVVLNNQKYEISSQLNGLPNNLKLSIGRKYNDEKIITEMGDYTLTYPLNGQVEMLILKDSYLEDDTLFDTISKMSCVTKLNGYDDFGMLKLEELNNNDSQILTKTINYKYKDTNNITHVVESETLNIANNNYTITYETDNLGRVTSIENSLIDTKTYQYNNKGYLINDNGVSITYDNNGNIITYGNNTFEYDPVIKDRLIKYNGETIEYSQSKPLYPVRYKDKTFKYEGNRLVLITEYYDNETTIYHRYYYNYNGLRIKKRVEYEYTDDRDSYFIETKYYYSNNKLITEYRSDNDRIDYLYDHNGLLYGFINNNIDIYYYIRDILQNILGIVDSNGNIVVIYNCNAYGGNQTILGNVSLGNRNPFRYKGYYYDVETNLFYVTSRYYSPELARFIQPADVSTLNSSSINGLNLYSYANNNPIGIAYSSSSVGVSVANQLINQNFSLLMVPNLGINKNNYSSSVHWKNEWLVTSWPSFLDFSNEKAALLDWGLSIYKGSLYFDEAENHSIYIGVGNVTAFAGYDVEKGRIGVFADVYLFNVGYDGRYIDAGISFVGMGFIFGIENKKLKIKLDPPGTPGIEISIDFGQIIKDIFGWEW